MKTNVFSVDRKNPTNFLEKKNAFFSVRRIVLKAFCFAECCFAVFFFVLFCFFVFCFADIRTVSGQNHFSSTIPQEIDSPFESRIQTAESRQQTNSMSGRSEEKKLLNEKDLGTQNKPPVELGKDMFFRTAVQDISAGTAFTAQEKINSNGTVQRNAQNQFNVQAQLNAQNQFKSQGQLNDQKQLNNRNQIGGANSFVSGQKGVETLPASQSPYFGTGRASNPKDFPDDGSGNQSMNTLLPGAKNASEKNAVQSNSNSSNADRPIPGLSEAEGLVNPQGYLYWSEWNALQFPNAVLPFENREGVFPPLTITAQTQFQQGAVFLELSNGLSVLLEQQPQETSVYVGIFVKKTGSGYEGRWSGSGIGRLLQEVLYNGDTEKWTLNERLQIQNQWSGALLSRMQSTLTSYEISVDARQTENALEILAQLLFRPILSMKDFQASQEKLRKEQRSLLSNPEFQAESFWRSSFYFQRPGRFPANGFPDVLASINRKDLIEYYREHYIPNRMILAVSGNFDEKEILAQITQVFAIAPRRFDPPEPLDFVPDNLYKISDNKQSNPNSDLGSNSELNSNFESNSDLGSNLELNSVSESREKERRQLFFEYPRLLTKEMNVKEFYVSLVWPTVSENHPDQLKLDLFAELLRQDFGNSLRSGTADTGSSSAGFSETPVLSAEKNGVSEYSASTFFPTNFGVQKILVENKKIPQDVGYFRITFICSPTFSDQAADMIFRHLDQYEQQYKQVFRSTNSSADSSGAFPVLGGISPQKLEEIKKANELLRTKEYRDLHTRIFQEVSFLAKGKLPETLFKTVSEQLEQLTLAEFLETSSEYLSKESVFRFQIVPSGFVPKWINANTLTEDPLSEEVSVSSLPNTNLTKNSLSNNKLPEESLSNAEPTTGIAPSDSFSDASAVSDIVYSSFKYLLENKLRLIILPDNQMGSRVEIQLLMQGGGLNDPLDKAGGNRLLASLMSCGPERLTREEFEQQKQQSSMTLNFQSNRCTFTGQMTLHKKDVKEGLSLFCETLNHPALRESDFVEIKEKALRRSFYQRKLEEKNIVLSQKSQKAVFPSQTEIRPSNNSNLQFDNAQTSTVQTSAVQFSGIQNSGVQIARRPTSSETNEIIPENSAFDELEKNWINWEKEGAQEFPDVSSNWISTYFIQAVCDLFPESSPFHLPLDGTPESLNQVTLSDLEGYWKKMTSPENMILVVHGNVDPKEIVVAVNETFSTISPRPAFRFPSTDRNNFRVQPMTRSVLTPLPYSVMLRAWATTGLKPQNQKELDTLSVYSALLAGYKKPGGLLNENLRSLNEKYPEYRKCSGYSNLMLGSAPGYFYVYLECDPSLLDQVTQKLNETIRQIENGQVSEQQLKNAKDQVLAQKSLISFSDRLTNFLLDLTYGFPIDYELTFEKRINNVSLADLIQFVQKYMNAEMTLIAVPTGSLDVSDNKNGSE